MSSQTQPRVHSGVPAGGQFATRSHEESDVALLDDEGYVAALYENAMASSRIVHRRTGIDFDELATSVITEMSKSDRGKWTSRPFVTAVAKNIAAKMLSANASGPDFEARSKYMEQWQDFAQANGRYPSASEEDEIADDIRQRQPAGRRARNNFHRIHFKDAYSLDSADMERLVQHHDSDIPAPTLVTDVRLEKQENTLSDLRKEKGIWAAISEAFNTPKVLTDGIEWNVASEIRKRINALGGVRKAADDYLTGELTDTDSEAFFAPWEGRGRKATGEMSLRDREKVAQTLTSLPQVGAPDSDGPAGEAWNDAVRVATRKKPRSERVWARDDSRGLVKEKGKRKTT